MRTTNEAPQAIIMGHVCWFPLCLESSGERDSGRSSQQRRQQRRRWQRRNGFSFVIQRESLVRVGGRYEGRRREGISSRRRGETIARLTTADPNSFFVYTMAAAYTPYSHATIVHRRLSPPLKRIGMQHRRRSLSKSQEEIPFGCSKKKKTKTEEGENSWLRSSERSE